MFCSLYRILSPFAVSVIWPYPLIWMCCIWAIGEQTRDANVSLPRSFSYTRESGWNLLNQYFLIQQGGGAKCWIGSWNFYPHCIRCTCLNSFYWAAKLEVKSGGENWNRSCKKATLNMRLQKALQWFKCICLNCKLYLSKLTNEFAEVANICLFQLKSGKWPWTCGFRRHERALQWLKCVCYLADICTTSETILCGRRHCVTHAIPQGVSE